jgi:hypothetical protein
MTFVIVGLALCIAGWLFARFIAGCRTWRPLPVLLDVLVPLTCFAFVALGTGKPLFAGVLICVMCVAFALADHTKRKTLFEPIVCADLFTAADIFRNPRICLIFPETKWVVVGLAGALALFAGLFLIDRAAIEHDPLVAAVIAAGTYGMAWLVANPLLARATATLQALQPSGDPALDSARFGPIATLMIHGILARGQREARRRTVLASAAPSIDLSASGGPVVVVQCESFFDARRLHDGITRELVPSFEACARKSVQWGRLGVPSVGANSVRTEFAVLTGLPESAIGFDRFNPYQGFARQPVASLASKLRAAGYYTICLHPFDRAFYGRDRVMGQLGFDEFIGLEGFTAARKVGLYTADVEVAHRIADIVQSHGPKVFVFAITMENHGPWQKRESGGETVATGLPALPAEADLLEFLRSVRNSDRMVHILADALASQAGATLAFYGDHLPSFPSAFAALGFTQRDTDYLVWRSEGGKGRRVDLVAHELHDAILSAVAVGKSVSHPRVVQLPASDRPRPR